MAQVESTFKDVRAKMFNSIDFFKLLVRIDNDLLVSEMHWKLGVTGFVSEIRRAENYFDFDKLPGACNWAWSPGFLG